MSSEDETMSSEDETSLGERDEPPRQTRLVRHEEEVAGVEKSWRTAGYMRARKHVEHAPVRETLTRDVEDVELERRPARANDSGRVETLPDGSISIPVYEEELVVTRRPVLRERVIIRKAVTTEHETIKAELRKEHVDVVADPGLEDRVVIDGGDEVAVSAPEEGGGDMATREREHVIRSGARGGDRGTSAWFDYDRPHETKPFFLTSEFLVLALGVIGLLIAANQLDNLDGERAWTLITVLGAAYLLSRGLAKAATRHSRYGDGH